MPRVQRHLQIRVGLKSPKRTASLKGDDERMLLETELSFIFRQPSDGKLRLTGCGVCIRDGWIGVLQTKKYQMRLICNGDERENRAGDCETERDANDFRLAVSFSRAVSCCILAT